MGRRKCGKLSKLLRDWPHGALLTSQWLEKQGISRQLMKRYEEGGWVVPFGRGVFGRAGDKVEWIGALTAIQQQLNKPIHAGARTALELVGTTHYPRARDTVFLFGPQDEKVPFWFLNHKWHVTIHYVPTNLFNEARRPSASTFRKIHFERNVILASTRERAALETMHLIPKYQSFDEAFHLMESLNSLRPLVLQRYLETCRSVKAKRLFMAMAERFDHPWLKALKLKKIDLGTGYRFLEKAGRTHPKYRITLPRWFFDESKG